MKKHTTEILCAGFGGQGIMFIGKLLARAGLNAGKHVTWMPSYGAEVRGGTAYSMTKISDMEIASPLVVRPDVLVAMNKPSLIKYQASVKAGGLIIANKTLIDGFEKIKGLNYVNVPLTEWASKLGSTKVANLIAMGILLKKTKAVSSKYVLDALLGMLKEKKDLFALNKRAFERGYRA